jgi:putative flippase GtrA
MLLSRLILDLLLKNLTTPVNIVPFPPQALGSFLAFLVSNILCKTVAYILNRKKTFRADSNAVFGAVVYIVMVVVLIVVETIVGTPLQNEFYILFGGKWTGDALNTSSVLKPTMYQLCGSLSIISCGLVDSLIVFLMEKFVIMKSSSNHSSSNTPV